MSEPGLHPYTNLPPQAFWRTAVADLDPRQIDLGWQPKSPISLDTGIITVGSCFAQHISRSLRENGFRWIDSEPAPAGLAPAEHAAQGYGVFSFRTGNIYTAALLRQWVMWAAGGQAAGIAAFEDKGRFYDPFRPALTVEGFASAGDMLEARRITLAAMLQAIRQADLFVFTLGLTEAWLNKDGSVYPMCPGTIRGTFSAAEHVFHNYSEPEIVRDLAATFDELRKINPKLRFMLTVSPVPLTATASGEHVLTATTHSKSVLRSAAGFLRRTRDDVDYFPSYELITAPAFKGQFFEQNMRSVSSDGVAFVMRQFFGAIGGGAASPAPAMPAAKAAAPARREELKALDEICDELVLETWSRKPDDDAGGPPNILLVGDSHMGKIAEVLDELGIRSAGGAIMNASEWDAGLFDLDEDTMFSPHDPEKKAGWRRIYAESFAERANSPRPRWLITNAGLQRHHAVFGNFEEYRQLIHGGNAPGDVKVIELYGHLLLSRKAHLALMVRFMQKGYSIIYVTDPPVEDPRLHEVMALADAFFDELYKSMGCSVFYARGWIDGLGGMPEKFRSKVPDKIHAGPEYYRQMTREMLSRFGIRPQYRRAGAPVT